MRICSLAIFKNIAEFPHCGRHSHISDRAARYFVNVRWAALWRQRRQTTQTLYPELFAPKKAARYERGSEGRFLLLADFVEKEDLDGITIFEDVSIEEEIDQTTCRDEWDITWRLNDQGPESGACLPPRSSAKIDGIKRESMILLKESCSAHREI